MDVQELELELERRYPGVFDMRGVERRWWQSPAGVDLMGASIGLAPEPGEHWTVYRVRIRQVLEEHSV